MNMQSLKDKKALITGASAGIGRSVALALASKGAQLFLVARRPEKLEELKKEILSQFPQTKISLLPFDINDPKISDELSKATGTQIDILINNAGVALGRDKIESSNFSDWESMIQTNITSNFKLAHL